MSSGGSTISSLKTLGRIGLAVASQTASVVASAAKQGVSSLQAPPSEITCAHCPDATKIVVPPHIFDWRCPTPHCASRGIIHERSVKVCDQCMGGRPELPNPTVRCRACGKETAVPFSNAAKHLQTAKEGVVHAAASAKAYSERTVADLKSAPAVIPCSSCTTALNVPPGIFDWKCGQAGCGRTNQSSASVCATCASPKPPRGPDHTVPALVCPVCHTSTVVPRSNAEKHLAHAAKTTKELAASASAAASAEYRHLKSAPRQFNCRTCNSLLQVPDYWVCKACAAHNYRPPQEQEEGKEAPDPDPACAVCNAPRDPKDEEEVLCGKCNTATSVPKSNFSNRVRKYSTTIARTLTKLQYDLTGTPYIKCDACETNIAVPRAGAGAGAEAAAAPKEIHCPKCKKVFLPGANLGA